MGHVDIESIDEVIHGRVRLGIVAYLSPAGASEFGEIKRALDLTDGNLSVHLRKLEEAGYVEIDKTYQGRKPLTRVKLLKKGREAFLRYLDAMSKIIRDAR